jgi:hypothetical protein
MIPLLKSLSARLPKRWQQALKRLHDARQIAMVASLDQFSQQIDSVQFRRFRAALARAAVFKARSFAAWKSA